MPYTARCPDYDVAGFNGALTKIKDELMLLGCISLLLLIVEDDLALICIPNKLPWAGGVKCAGAPVPAPAPMPAPAPASAAAASVLAPSPANAPSGRRLLTVSGMLPYIHPVAQRRLLAAAETPSCEDEVDPITGIPLKRAFLDECRHSPDHCLMSLMGVWA